jgi:hypothetical protein
MPEEAGGKNLCELLVPGVIRNEAAVGERLLRFREQCFRRRKEIDESESRFFATASIAAV